MFHMSEDYVKSYILQHTNLLVKDSLGLKNCRSLKYDNFYYTEVSICVVSDKSYKVILWGDRESFFWNLKKDFYFTVDIDKQLSLNKDVSKDIAIYSILKGYYK